MLQYCEKHMKRGHWLSYWVIISAFEMCALPADTSSDTQAVVAFKRHLATPPCYSKILFSEADCNNNIVRRYYVAICDENYVYRSLYGNENVDLPISISNRNRSSVYVGRWRDMHWAIAGYDLTIEIQPSPTRPAPDGSSYVFVNELLTFGFQHVQAGTFVWRGDHFVAKPSLFARELGQTENFTGKIIVEDGLVKRMIVEKAGVSEFQYDDSTTSIPHGLPSVISKITADGHCTSRWLIHNMTKASAEETAALFDPNQRIHPELVAIRVISNGVETVAKAQNPQMRKEILAEQLADFVSLTQRVAARRSFIQRTFMLVVFLLLVSGIWYLWKHIKKLGS